MKADRTPFQKRIASLPLGDLTVMFRTLEHDIEHFKDDAPKNTGVVNGPSGANREPLKKIKLMNNRQDVAFEIARRVSGPGLLR